MRVAFTGHRLERLGIRSLDVADSILTFLTNLKGTYGDALHVISGMAQGVDQIAANTAIALGIPFTAAVPWVGFASNWPPEHRAVYLDTLDHAANVVVTCDTQEYRPWVYQKRDEWMVDNSDFLAAVWDEVKQGGTWNTVKYAIKVGRQDKIMYLDWGYNAAE
jgi:uncharacterized phage-like protein YoqJ